MGRMPRYCRPKPAKARERKTRALVSMRVIRGLRGPVFETVGFRDYEKQPAEAAQCTVGKRCWGASYCAAMNMGETIVTRFSGDARRRRRNSCRAGRPERGGCYEGCTVRTCRAWDDL